MISVFPSSISPAFMATPASVAGRELVAQLRDACHGPGFCYLAGHGVPADLDAAVMTAARDFFALPLADKRALAIASSPHFRGYTVLGDERTKGVNDWREQLDVGAEEPAPPSHPASPPGDGYAARINGRRGYPRCNRPCSRG